MPGCQVPPLNGTRGAALETSLNTLAIRTQLARPTSPYAKQAVSLPSSVKSHSPFGSPTTRAALDRLRQLDPDVDDRHTAAVVLVLHRPGDERLSRSARCRARS